MDTQFSLSTNSLSRLHRAARVAPMALIAALAASPLFAGPVAPPVGPVAPTMKTLAEVEPRTAIKATNTPGDADSIYRITQPGSYYLTGNLTGAAGKRGIEIAASNVTIDLCGFTVAGVSGSLTGIGVESTAFDRTVVTNGIITGWPSGGVLVNNHARLSGLTLHGNTAFGLRAGTDANVDSCTARGNNGAGIEVDDGSLAHNCVTAGNSTAGLDLAGSCRAERCVSTANSGDGINGSNASVLAWCTADDNGGNGISSADQSTVVDCSVSGNTGAGISASWGVLIARCSALVNTGPGIRASNGSRVENNNCRVNGSGAGLQAGILVPAGSIRVLVMNNTCTGNDYGIRIDGTSCLIKGHTVSSNTTTNFEIVANNRVATILTLPLAGAVSGNTGGTTISDPDANYVY